MLLHASERNDADGVKHQTIIAFDSNTHNSNPITIYPKNTNKNELNYQNCIVEPANIGGGIVIVDGNKFVGVFDVRRVDLDGGVCCCCHFYLFFAFCSEEYILVYTNLDGLLSQHFL